MSVIPPDPAPANPPLVEGSPHPLNGRASAGAGREDRADPTPPYPVDAQLASIADRLGALEQQTRAINMGLLCAGLGLVMLSAAILKSKGAAAAVA